MGEFWGFSSQNHKITLSNTTGWFLLFDKGALTSPCPIWLSVHHKLLTIKISYRIACTFDGKDDGTIGLNACYALYHLYGNALSCAGKG